jgi:putative sigma-54 modulation protein
LKGVKTLQINISGRHIRVTEDLRKYAEGKAEKLSRYFDRIQKVDVVLACDGEQRTAEMIVAATHGTTLVGHATAKDIRAAIDAAVDKLEIQTTRMKEKLRSHRARSSESLRARATKKPGSRSAGPAEGADRQPGERDEEE